MCSVCVLRDSFTHYVLILKRGTGKHCNIVTEYSTSYHQIENELTVNAALYIGVWNMLSVSISEYQGIALLNFILSCFPAGTRIYNTNFTDSNGPEWSRGYRSWTVPQRSRVRVPCPPVEKQRPIYLDCACRLQWATIRCGKHVHTG